MVQKEKMTWLFLGLVVAAAVIVTAVLYAFVWRRSNPPLPTTTAQIVAASSTSNTATTTAATSTAVGAPIVEGENPALPTETLAVENATFTVEVASSMLQRMSGLSFRPSLPQDHGMLFIFGTGTIQTFWMKDMNFPLDMIWISGTTVVGFAQNAEPQPGAMLWQLTIYASPDNTDKVLEVNAGTVAKYNIKVGDTIRVGQMQ